MAEEILVKPTVVNVLCDILVERGPQGADLNLAITLAAQKGFNYSSRTITNALNSLTRDQVLCQTEDGRYRVPAKIKHTYGVPA